MRSNNNRLPFLLMMLCLICSAYGEDEAWTLHTLTITMAPFSDVSIDLMLGSRDEDKANSPCISQYFVYSKTLKSKSDDNISLSITSDDFDTLSKDILDQSNCGIVSIKYHNVIKHSSFEWIKKDHHFIDAAPNFSLVNFGKKGL